MTFGGDPYPNSSGGGTSTPPPYTPTHADPSVITAGLAGYRPGQSNAALSTQFKSLIGGAGGLGRKASATKRSLIGGAN